MKDKPLLQEFSRTSNQIKALEAKLDLLPKLKLATSKTIDTEVTNRLVNFYKAESKKAKTKLSELQKTNPEIKPGQYELDSLEELIEYEAYRFDSVIDEVASQDHLNKIHKAKSAEDISKLKEIKILQDALKKARKETEHKIRENIEYLSSGPAKDSNLKEGDIVWDRSGTKAIFKGIHKNGNAIIYYPVNGITRDIPLDEIRKLDNAAKVEDEKTESQNQKRNEGDTSTETFTNEEKPAGEEETTTKRKSNKMSKSAKRHLRKSNK